MKCAFHYSHRNHAWVSFEGFSVSYNEVHNLLGVSGKQIKAQRSDSLNFTIVLILTS